MEQDKQKNIIDLDDIIYEEPIQKIEELNIDTLSQFSEHFRMSYKNMEKQMANNKNQHQDVNTFHENIVKLIGKIQPSKAALSFVLIEVEEILQEYYGDSSKIEQRNNAKSKNIFAMDYLTPPQEKEMFVEVKNSIDQIKRCLLLRESQLGMVIYIQDNVKKYPPQQFAKMYESYFQEIKEYVIPIEKCFMPINYPLLSQILENESLYYEQFGNKATVLQEEMIVYSKQLQNWQTLTWTSKFSTEKHIKMLKILSSKISTIADLFSFACIKSQEDLFSKNKTDQRWKKLFEKEIITYKLYGDSATVHKSFDKLKANLNVINAAMNILSQTGNLSGIKKLTKNWESAGKVLKVALFKENALHEAEVMISNPSEVLAKEIWNLPERAQFKKFIELGLPSIEFSIRLFIPRLAKDYFYGKLKQDYGILPNFNIDNPSQYYNDLQIENKDKVSIRINHSFKLILKEFQTQQVQKQSNIFKHTLSEMGKKIQTGVETLKSNFKKIVNQIPKEVIFHIHGGGFISMSSFIHQAYTRNWANNLKVPIVSVDYGKAPQHPYPEGLADCLEAYLWTMHSMRQIYEFQPQKVILVGDSAGGNLVAALTNVLIKWNLRKPDGIVMVYPALNLNYFDYSPSLLTALNDMILPHTFLKICLKSYLKDKSVKPDADYLVSPILTPTEILKKYPQTRIFVGSKDPFHDDCCRFAQKLSVIDPQRVHLMIFEEFPHGFLQFDMKNQPHYYCRQATKQVEQSLKYLLISKPIQF